VLIALVVVALAAAVCVAYGIAIERRWYRLRSYDLAILPSDGPDRLDVLHLSDLTSSAATGRSDGSSPGFRAPTSR